MDMAVMREIIEKFDSNKKWIILCHENPDGDTMGCGLALYSLGKRLGKDVRIMGRDPIPERYWAITVASAAPTTPRSHPIANLRSRAMFTAAETAKKPSGITELPMARR